MRMIVKVEVETTETPGVVGNAILEALEDYNFPVRKDFPINVVKLSVKPKEGK